MFLVTKLNVAAITLLSIHLKFVSEIAMYIMQIDRPWY